MHPTQIRCKKKPLSSTWPLVLLGFIGCHTTVEGAVISSTSGGNVNAPGPNYSTTATGTSGTILLSSGNGSTITGGLSLTLLTSGSSAPAITAQNNGQINLSALNLTTTGSSSYGIEALSGGDVNISGPATINTSAIALYVDGSGSSITGSNVAATASGASSVAASVTGGGTLTLNGTASSLKNKINGNYVATVSGAGSKMNLTNTTVSSNATSNDGIYVANGATLSMTGGSVISNGANQQALNILGGSTVNLTNTILQTAGDQSVVILAQNSSQVTLNNVQLNITGNTSLAAMSALIAQSGSTVTMNGGSINYTGNGGNGANSFFSGSNLNLNDVTINTNGTGSWGVLSQAGALNIKDSAIVTTGADSDGVHLSDNFGTFGSGSAVAFSGNNSILTQGPSSHGIAIDGGTQLTIDAASNPLPTITVEGSGSALIRSDGQYNGLPSKVTIQNGTQMANGGAFDNTIGAYASNGGQFAFKPGTGVTMGGTGSDALRIEAAGSLISGDQATFSVSGSGAHVAHLIDGGTLNLTNSTLSANGIGANALFTTSTASGMPANSVTLSDTTLSSASGPVIAVAGGSAAISIARGLIDSSGGIAVQIGPNNAALPANVTLQVDATHIIGAILTDSSSTSTLTLTNNSQWDMTGDSTVTNLVNDPSIIQFSPPVGGVFKTLTVNGNYQGEAGSIIVLNTQLGTDNSPTDKLIVLGDTSGGTGLRIINAGGSGGLTIADGIEVVQVGGASNGTFTLTMPAVAGAYEYGLYKGTLGGSGGNWYLRSSAPPVDPPGNPPVDPPGNPQPPVAPPLDPPMQPAPPPAQASPTQVYRGDAGAYLANQAAASTMFLHTLHDRLGEPQFTDNNLQTGNVPSFWVRTTGSRTDYQAGGSQGTFDLRTDTGLVQAGAELAHWTDNANNRLHFGVMGGYGNASSDSSMRNPDGVLKQSSGTVDGYSLGMYATWFGNQNKPSGPYVDLWALYGWYDNSVSYANTPNQDYSSHSITVSIEAGYAFKLKDLSNGRALMLEPQAQIAYTNYRADKHVDYSGTVIDSDDDGAITRLGARLYSRPLSGVGAQPFIEMNWWHSNGQSVSFNDTAIDGNIPENRFEIKAGVQGELVKNWQAWANIGYQGGSDGYSRLEGIVGVKHLF